MVYMTVTKEYIDQTVTTQSIYIDQTVTILNKPTLGLDVSRELCDNRD